jgi:hypothetical protein
MKTKPSSKNLRSKSLLIVFLFLFGNNINIKAQMNNWAMPPYKFDVIPSPPLITNLYAFAPNFGSYNIANAAYDSNNQLLFFVKNSQVFNSNGTSVGHLGKLTGYWNSVPTAYNYDFGGEIVIVPKPLECNKFYVIYTHGEHVGYTLVDCTNPTSISLAYATSPYIYGNYSSTYANGGNIIGSFPNLGGNTPISEPYYGGPGYYCLNTGLAVSKRRNSPGGGFIYYLYMVNDGKVYYSTITANGISPVSTAIYNCGIPSKSPTEVELSDDGQYLAFNAVAMFDNCAPNFPGCTNNGYYKNNSGEIYIVKLINPTTAAYEWSNNFTNSVINGLEFLGSTTPTLFVAGELYAGPNSPNGPTTIGFLKKCDFANNTITDCIPPLAGPTGITPLQDGHLQPKKTFLERTKNGKIAYICYAFNNPTGQYGNRYFVEYNDNTQTFNTTQIDATTGINVNPNDISPLAANPANTNFLFRTYKCVFTLPDQIDGEDYWKFTNPNIAIGNMNINGQYNPNCDPNNWQIVYNCDRINLDVGLESGEACRVDIKYEPVTKDCVELPGGFYFTGQLEHAISSTNPIKNHDIRGLVDGRGQGLTNQPGYYKITAIVTDCCGNKSSRSTYVRVLSGIPPQINLELFDYSNSQVYQSVSHVLSNPVLVGAVTVGYRVSGSNGNITAINVELDEVNSSGTSILNVINEIKQVNNLTSLTYENLNNYCVPGSVWNTIPNGAPLCNVNSPIIYSGARGYFAANSNLILGKTYKLKVTLINPCSSAPEWTYINFNSTFQREMHTTAIGENSDLLKLPYKVYPNPAQNELSFNFINTSADPISIFLYDISGRIVKTIKKDAILSLDEQQINADIQNLENGTYFWNISNKKINKYGKVIISK